MVCTGRLVRPVERDAFNQILTCIIASNQGRASLGICVARPALSAAVRGVPRMDVE